MKLNKGQAMEAITNRLDFEVATADARVLRIMDYTQLNQSAQRLIDIEHAEFLENVNPLYREHVRNMGVTKIYSTWCAAVRNLEDTDPVLVAEKAARNFVYTVDHMITGADETLAKFAARFAENPADAFENSANAMQAAADKDMALRAKSMLETHSVDEVKAYMLDSLKYADGARLSGSTCPTTNLMARAKMVATMQLAGLRY